MRALICAAATSVVAHAGKVLTRRHVDGLTGGIVRPLEFQHQLRVCNAFPYAAALDVYRDKGEKLTEAGPMAYKECRDFAQQLKEGDRIDFKVGDSSTGTFSISELPSNDAVLLLVVQRHDTSSTAVSFDSHVFASGLHDAQIAVIDAYKGSTHTSARIADVGKGGPSAKTRRQEELRYNNVVAVSPGAYEVMLAGTDGATKANTSLVALQHGSYVVLRTGIEAKQGRSYPEELVVYPQSALRGAAARFGVLGQLLALVAAATTAVQNL